MPMAASSSSACTTAKVRLPSAPTRCFLRNSSAYSARLLEGVIGYQVSTLAPPKVAPSAAALFPSIRIFCGASSIRWTWNGRSSGRFAWAQSKPVRTALMLISAALALRRGTRARMAASTASISILHAEARTPT